MAAVLSRLPVAAEPGWEPLTETRAVEDCLIAGSPLSRWQEDAVRAALGDDFEGTVQVAANAWLETDDLAALAATGRGGRLTGPNGEVLCRFEPPGETGGSDVTAAASFPIRFTWQFLDLQEKLLDALSESRIDGDVHGAVHTAGVLVVGEGSRLLPGTFIEGPVVIGAGCVIGPNCYLRGRTSIADGCKVGQAVEVKNSILYPGATIGHLSYCGDSIIGAGVNFGAGTIVSNYRHDAAHHRSEVAGQLIDTGRTKFGTIVGDGVHTGIHTAIYPGRKLWPGTSTRPGEIVQYDKR